MGGSGDAGDGPCVVVLMVRKDFLDLSPSRFRIQSDFFHSIENESGIIAEQSQTN